jgi:2-dehydro-3-deoxyphosphogluconate aldolase/(4S)-4-hydroxy-2-oxoglutarate aldolase
MDAGAKIISSPVFQTNLLKISKDKQVPFIAGTSTANEAYNAWKCRIPVVKIYPITAMGGVQYIENLLRPMPFLNVIPQGNVQLEEVQSYIDAGAIAVGVGRQLTNCESYSEITKRATKLLESLK